MNIHIPQNGDATSDLHKEADGSESPFGYFAGILIGIFLVGCGMVTLIRYWRWRARQKWNRIRGAETPAFWDGFWGWQ